MEATNSNINAPFAFSTDDCGCVANIDELEACFQRLKAELKCWHLIWRYRVHNCLNIIQALQKLEEEFLALTNTYETFRQLSKLTRVGTQMNSVQESLHKILTVVRDSSLPSSLPSETRTDTQNCVAAMLKLTQEQRHTERYLKATAGQTGWTPDESATPR